MFASSCSCKEDFRIFLSFLLDFLFDIFNLFDFLTFAPFKPLLLHYVSLLLFSPRTQPPFLL